MYADDILIYINTLKTIIPLIVFLRNIPLWIAKPLSVSLRCLVSRKCLSHFWNETVCRFKITAVLIFYSIFSCFTGLNCDVLFLIELI